MIFEDELSKISTGQSLPRSNSLLRLTPFLDPSGLLRVGGRLQSSQLSESAKHPLILPKKSALTSLIIADAHLKTLHGGTQVTVTFLRNEYWIIGGRSPVRSFILKCVRCSRYRQNRAQQIIGQLPFERVTPSRPFLHTGVDYAGPLLLKNWKGKNSRKYKAYIALFVCQAISAIHLELVTDYSTEAFIAAFKRFTARRGICATLRSDCGTNFKGADSELQNLFSKNLKELGDLATLLSNDGTQWLFNPPAAPHFGEAVLNSRPLSCLSDDPEDLHALTPGHFLTGSSLTTIPEPSLLSVKGSRLSRWQLTRQMLESFWTRWSRECLQRHLAIYKWNRISPSLQEGSLVLITDERYPPSKWPLGRIVQTHPGKDGQFCVENLPWTTFAKRRSVTTHATWIELRVRSSFKLSAIILQAECNHPAI
ncbi:uncharacterized protein LOC112639712 [Camponotus floridanus]|uniref:uncharacterized protein LOC112639712 n=1 Tax=Camponotus floridanus TaxID=104421 RepID=UPI000DC67AB1|nr:uncharacterized protein LOC112639712 [Camponotus floridanus]